jgi:hypothetical protein
MDLLKPHIHDIGGLQVRRLLPAATRKMVGPFIFFDHFGPVAFAPGHGMDVRPHPHIGLATVSYLFEGAIVHRDSLGCVQRIVPGDVNWMTAGSGIVHSERTAAEDRLHASRLHGVQTWVALPLNHEGTAPAFSHHPAETLPRISRSGVQMRLIAGRAFGERAPATTFSDMFYLAADMTQGAELQLAEEHEERAVYVVEGELAVGDTVLPAHQLALLPARGTVALRAVTGASLLLFGGARMDGERHIWWNFVASSRDLIEGAKADWRAQRFPAIPGESEFIPLPE